MFDYTHANTLAGSILVETLVRLGLTQAVVCPGSRSSPLTIAFARHPRVDCVVSLDERSAAFFALGYAKRTRQPVAIVCTSGTAAANFYPAIIEAHYSQVPLLVLTGDRPPLLRHCRAGQTVNQTRLFGTYPQWQIELALPVLTTDYAHYLRQTIIQAWRHCSWPQLGVVHINCPFTDPLAPIPDATAADAVFPQPLLKPETFYQSLMPTTNRVVSPMLANPLPADFQSPPLGLITVGVLPGGETPRDLHAIQAIANALNYPILSDALSAVRNFSQPGLQILTHYDFLLRCPHWSGQLIPEVVLQIGELPTSKELRAWLTTHNPRRYCLGSAGNNLDPLHGHTQVWDGSLEQFAHALTQRPDPSDSQQLVYNQRWQRYEQQSQAIIRQQLMVPSSFPLFTPQAIALLPDLLPPQTQVFIANSLPIRWCEFFWPANTNQHQVFVNRGANGIDGTLSTAMGLAHRQAQPTLLITGDLSLLHDSNGFLNQPQLQGQLTILLLNNHGGGIFELLPIAAVEDVFEAYFATPQTVEIAQLCHAYHIAYQRIEQVSDLKAALSGDATAKIQVIELIGDRRAEANWLRNVQSLFSGGDMKVVIA